MQTLLKMFKTSVDISVSVWVLLFSLPVASHILKGNIKFDFFEMFLVVEEVVNVAAV